MKHLSILVPDEQNSLSTIACIAGALEIFTSANAYRVRQGGEPRFKIELVSASDGATVSNSVFALTPHTSVNKLHRTDLILIPSSGVRTYEETNENNQRMIRWIAQQYKDGAEVASLCSGAFLLAATGIMDGRECSTHWAHAGRFGQTYPKVRLKTDKIITDEGGVYTNGGAYSFLNLVLYLVEKYYDRQTCIHCAKYFQVDIGRSAQSPFSIFSGHKSHDDEVILKAQDYLEQHFPDKISIEELSTQFAIGRRNFDRRFIKATGLTPLDYLQRVRIEAAKGALENARKTVNEVMYEVGYNDVKAFREVFSRVTGMSPLDYKGRYYRSA